MCYSRNTHTHTMHFVALHLFVFSVNDLCFFLFCLSIFCLSFSSLYRLFGVRLWFFIWLVEAKRGKEREKEKSHWLIAFFVQTVWVFSSHQKAFLLKRLALLLENKLPSFLWNSKWSFTETPFEKSKQNRSHDVWHVWKCVRMSINWKIVFVKRRNPFSENSSEETLKYSHFINENHWPDPFNSWNYMQTYLTWRNVIKTAKLSLSI